MNKKKVLFGFGGFMVIVALLFVFVSYNLKTKNLFEGQLREDGKIIVGTFSEFKPFTFKGDDGEYLGHDIDLIKMVAERMELEVEFKEIFFLDLFGAVENNEIDIAISGITITPERQKKVLFSNPYINVGQVVVIRKDNKEIESVEDIDGKKVGVTKGTTLEDSAKKLTSDELVFAYDDLKEVEALKEGEVDALIRDYVEALALIKNNPDFRIAGDPFVQDYYGIMTNKKNKILIMKINEILGQISKDSSLKKMRLKWLGE